MTEAVIKSERPYPKGIYEVPGVEPVPVVLQEYGQQVAQRIHDVREQTGAIPPIVAPLNGSVVPLFAVCKEWQAAGGCAADIAHQVHLISTRKVDDKAECVQLTEGDLGAFAFTVEDIIDDGGTAAIIEETYPGTSFELYAPLSKAGKLAKAQAKLARTKAMTTRTVNDVWIIGGGGLDGGEAKLEGLYPYQKVDLTVAERLMDRYVYHDTDEPIPPYDQQLNAFLAANIQDIKPTSTLHMWMLRAEWAKMTGQFRILKDLASLFPFVLQTALES